MTTFDEIPRATTPAGGYGAEMPPPILGGRADPIPTGAPDLAGLWRVASAVDGAGTPVGDDHPILRHVERVEQSGSRVVVTSDGIIHDMVCDGTVANGVHDVMQTDFTTPIVVVAAFEDGVHVLRPDGLPGVEVRRWREGEHLMWSYHVLFTARLERVG